MPNSEGPRSITTLEPSRIRVIQLRLENNFYSEGPASERIAAGVLADLRHLDESSTAFPQ